MKMNKDDLPPTDGEWEYNRHASCWCSFLNGQLHNSLGPAIIYNNGRKTWCVNGKYHRLDGPAVEGAAGSKAWYVNDEFVSEQDFPFVVISFLLGVDFRIAGLLEQEMKL